MLIIPAIDIRGGLCVRLSQGDYAQEKVYASDPASVALSFEEAGAQYIHVVDLDGAKSGSPQNWTEIESLLKVVSVPIEVGGGVRSLETAKRLLDLGVARVVVGTKLVQDPDLAQRFFEELGEYVVAGIDARDGLAAVSGWTEESRISAKDLAIKMTSLGAKRIILTDIAKDGMLTGPNIHLLDEVSEAVQIPIIQSGGIGSLEHLRLLAIDPKRKPEGVITGRAIYEGLFTVKEACDLCASL